MTNSVVAMLGQIAQNTNCTEATRSQAKRLLRIAGIMSLFGMRA